MLFSLYGCNFYDLIPNILSALSNENNKLKSRQKYHF